MNESVTHAAPFSAVNIPNLFTMTRILLVPCLFLSMYYELQGIEVMRFWTRFLLVLIILSDFLDGYLARLLKATTVLGSLLDPFADKLFVLTSYIILAVFNKIPDWLAIIVVSKDILVVAGWIVITLLSNQMTVRPSLLGKTATALQFFTVCGVIFLGNGFITVSLFYLTACVTVSALIHYGYKLAYLDVKPFQVFHNGQRKP